MHILAGIFLVLHGLVHLLYAGQSCRMIELRPGLTWPDGAWAFSKWLGARGARRLAAAALALAALGFAAGGLGIFLQQEWWRPVMAGAAVFSAVIFLLFWDGKFQHLDDKGGIGVLINLVILIIK